MKRYRIVLAIGLAAGAAIGTLAFIGGVNLPISIALGFMTASIWNLIAADSAL